MNSSIRLFTIYLYPYLSIYYLFLYIQVGVTPPPNTPGIVTRADILLSAAKKERN